MTEQSSDDDEPHFTFHLIGTTNADNACSQLRCEPDFASVMHMSGSLSPTLQPHATHFAALLRATRGLVHFDPNPRPRLILSTIGKQEYLERLAKWMAYVDIVKISAADLDWLYAEREVDDVARGWCVTHRSDPGPLVVIVTRGKQGARLFWSLFV
jgi:sugar/nucleoside kinase (ribokinase family)